MSWSAPRLSAKTNRSTRSHLSLQPVTSPRADSTELSVVERGMITKVLKECRGNKTRAARSLGLVAHTVALRIRKYRLEDATTA